MYRLLWKLKDTTEIANGAGEYDTREQALASAKTICQTAGHTVIVTQDMDEVQMAPMVSSLQPVPPGVVYRGAVPAIDETPRTPQSKPRLLIVRDRRATPAEIFGHLMVVAEGHIVKNAFGALSIEDMPLNPEELAEVTEALRMAAPK